MGGKSGKDSPLDTFRYDERLAVRAAQELVGLIVAEGVLAFGIKIKGPSEPV